MGWMSANGVTLVRVLAVLVAAVAGYLLGLSITQAMAVERPPLPGLGAMVTAWGVGALLALVGLVLLLPRRTRSIGVTVLLATLAYATAAYVGRVAG